MYFHITFSYII